MEYLALYRKYRPKELSEVVGQTEIKQILSSSVKNGTISHAYLFSGPRGTGKTTMAKILARMVNCEHPVDGDACNNCNTCLTVLNSSDVIEIDAASNNGVDEIRDLREKANLVPTYCKYKVYIIDEVHMLTTQAFNALLKTLEEPPKHVIFILATTEYYKIPLTITSRCQKFQFNKITNDDIVNRLGDIAKKEGIDISLEALYEIARISDGGMRDSINYLDQLRSFNGDKILLDDVYNVCGSVTVKEMEELLVNIKNNNAEFVTSFFETMNINGKNYNKFFEDLICFLKDIILYKRDVSEKYIKFNIDTIKNISDLYSLSDVFKLVYAVNDLYDKIKLVSRQSVVVISNFLIIMNSITCKSNDNIEQSVIENKQDHNYEMAFDFTSTKMETISKLTSDSLQTNVDSDKQVDNNYVKNKDIIINNAFALADKKNKSNLQKKISMLDNYLTDKKFSSAASILMDTCIQVVGENYVIFSGNYDAVVSKIINNYKLCKDLLEKIFEGEYHFVVVSNDEWEKLRDEYIQNLKSNKKYELKKLGTNIIVNEKVIKDEPTIVDKLFDIVGEDIIEFK